MDDAKFGGELTQLGTPGWLHGTGDVWNLCAQVKDPLKVKAHMAATLKQFAQVTDVGKCNFFILSCYQQ